MTSNKPKTHSEVLWHFTGGPNWDSKKNCQMKSLKSQAEAYSVALKILGSGELRLGGYHELIKVAVPEYRLFDHKTRKRKILKNQLIELKTSKVCCVADIPESELFHHSLRYGKMGIGFKRESLIKSGFNPVFYTLHTTDIAKKFFSAQQGLVGLEAYEVEHEVDGFINDIESELCERCEENLNIDGSLIVDAAESQIWPAQESLEDLEKIMSFVKTFNSGEFNSIYAEREWRSLDQFNFKTSDIEAIIFPNQKLLEKFCSTWSKKLKIPKRVKLSVFGENS